MFIEVCDKIGKRLDCIDTMREYIEEAGFVNIHEKNAKFPHGTWFVSLNCSL